MDKKLSISIYHQIELWWYAGAFPLRPRPATPRGPSFSADQRVSVSPWQPSSLITPLSFLLHQPHFLPSSVTLSIKSSMVVWRSPRQREVSQGCCLVPLLSWMFSWGAYVRFFTWGQLSFQIVHTSSPFLFSLYFIIRVYNIIYFCFTNNIKDYKLFTELSNQVSKISGQ